MHLNALECVEMNYCWSFAFCQFLDLFPKKHDLKKKCSKYFAFFEVKTVIMNNVIFVVNKWLLLVFATEPNCPAETIQSISFYVHSSNNQPQNKCKLILFSTPLITSLTFGPFDLNLSPHH